MKHVLLIGLLVLLIACSPEMPETPESPSEPVVCPADARICPDGSTVSRQGPDCAFAECPETIPEAQEDSDVPEEMHDADLIEPETESTAIAQNEVITVYECNRDERTLHFAFENTGDDTWVFGILPFPPPPNKLSVNVYFNNYDLTNDKPYYDSTSKNALFGPGTTFEENCGVTELKPGESAECELTNVPILLEDARRQDQLWLSAPEGTTRLFFPCD